MERSKSLGEQALEFRTLLVSEQLSAIDFDLMAHWLDQVAGILQESQVVSESLTALRQDYEGRIVGMIKAMAAIDQKGRSHEDMLSTFDSLAHMSGEELVACYRRTSAQFRDMFPTSIRMHGMTLPRRNPADMSVYK